MPLSAYAQPRSFKELVNVFVGIINLLIPLVIALTFIVFLWGIVQAWILGGGDETKVTQGKQIAIWGIIVFVVMIGVWGILALIRSGLFGI